MEASRKGARERCVAAVRPTGDVCVCRACVNVNILKGIGGRSSGLAPWAGRRKQSRREGGVGEGFLYSLIWDPFVLVDQTKGLLYLNGNHFLGSTRPARPARRFQRSGSQMSNNEAHVGKMNILKQQWIPFYPNQY